LFPLQELNKKGELEHALAYRYDLFFAMVNVGNSSDDPLDDIALLQTSYIGLTHKDNWPMSGTRESIDMEEALVSGAPYHLALSSCQFSVANVHLARDSGPQSQLSGPTEGVNDEWA
jgi:hypothetical protein